MTTLADELRGRSVGLALSSGFFGFFHHAGVLFALEELGIAPRRVAGTSAGALVGALYAAGLTPSEVRDALLAIRRQDFWDVHFPFTPFGFGLLAGHGFRAALARALPVHGFDQCRIPFAAAAYDLETGRIRYLDGGSLVDAVYASSAVPYLFTPAEIEGRRYLDGGFGEKTPLAPFLGAPPVDTVLVSYVWRARAERRPAKGILGLLPEPRAFFAHIPQEERRERDAAAVKGLRDAGKRVLVVAPEAVSLGPFSLERGAAAFEQGRAGARRVLESSDESLLGAPDLS